MSSLQKPKVLVVEDGLLYRRVMAIMAEEMGYEVVEASTVEEALLKLGGLSLIILDMKLPDGTGSDVLDRLDQIESDVPVIVASGYPEEFKGHVEHKNIVIWLDKPFSPVEFRNSIARAVQVNQELDTLKDNNRRLGLLINMFRREELLKPI